MKIAPGRVRRVLRSGEASTLYERERQPRPRLGTWKAALDRMLAENAGTFVRERLTLIRQFDELRSLGYQRGLRRRPPLRAGWEPGSRQPDNGGLSSAVVRPGRSVMVRPRGTSTCQIKAQPESSSGSSTGISTSNARNSVNVMLKPRFAASMMKYAFVNDPRAPHFARTAACRCWIEGVDAVRGSGSDSERSHSITSSQSLPDWHQPKPARTESNLHAGADIAACTITVTARRG